MTTHLSTRLVWHDRAWDGHICDQPGKNAYCIVQQHIRDGRDDAQEEKAAGLPLAKLNGWQPPCSRDPGAFSEHPFTISHNDPLEFRQLPSVREDIPAYSVCPSPYRWMREENFRDICEDEKLDIRESDDKGTSDRCWCRCSTSERTLGSIFSRSLKAGRSVSRSSTPRH